MGEQIREGDRLDASLCANKVDDKIIIAEFPHHLAADTAGREWAGDDAVLAAADSQGGKVPMAIVDRLEESRPAHTVGEKEAFSMLQPWYTVPSLHSSAAPTL